MRSRNGLFLVFAFVFVTVFCLGFVPKSVSQGEGTNFHFSVYLRSVDWNTRSFDAYVTVRFVQSPYSLSHPMPSVQNTYQSEGLDIHNAAGFLLFSTSGGPPYNLEGNVTTDFQLAGPTQFYPFDRYVLNITFLLPLHVQEWNVSASSIINQTNTWVEVHCQLGEFDMTFDPPVPGGSMPKFSNITYQLSTASEGVEAGVEWVSLNCKVILFRPASSTNLILYVLGICYFLVGSLPLIKPERLDYRLSVCLSLFVFSVTLTFTIQAPQLTSATLAETLILVLLTAAGMFSIVSIIQKALIEVRQRLAVCQYIVEGLVIWFLIFSLNSAFTLLAMSATSMTWASIPPTLSPFLMIGLSYGYVAVTLAFIWRNRGRIRKRLGAIRIFGKHEPKDTSARLSENLHFIRNVKTT